MNLSYERIDGKYADSGARLVIDAYNEERLAVPFLPEHPDMMNITGAYVLENERKLGTTTLLLSAVQR